MTRELLILRHGKSDWSRNTSDFDRPLKTRGERNAEHMGVWIHGQGLLPDHWISSPAVRARDTAQRCAAAMQQDARAIHYEDTLYEAGLSPLLAALGRAPATARRVALVGHNPGLEDLLIHLTGDRVPSSPDGKLLPTATLVRLAMPDDWQRLDTGCARLLSITRPGELPRLFPYPSPDGTERRKRPAYYYRQAAALPYRLHKGRLEFLLVSSRGRKRWVLPKGIQDPGLTAREAAAKEAFEEAGIEGETAAESIGGYRYRKWGGDCEVALYPLRVESLRDAPAWQESGRKRKWMSPKKAQEAVDEPKLQALLKQFAKRLEATGDA